MVVKTTALSQGRARGLSLRGVGLVLALTGSVLVDEPVEPGAIKGHEGAAGSGPIHRISWRK
jgi:hypothetical protein